jgi:hypothetical protein
VPRIPVYLVVDANCPPGVRTGDPISPDSGYTFDGLVR